MEKSPIFLGAVGSENGQTGVSLALNSEHTRQRRALGYLFTNSALLQQESLLRLHVHKLMGVLKKLTAENKAVDFSSWCKLSHILYSPGVVRFDDGGVRALRRIFNAFDIFQCLSVLTH